jgi:hypothetical protein
METPKREIELEPDAWERFERAVAVVAKSPPQHRVKKTKRSLAKAKPRSASRKKQEKRKQSGD